MARPLTHVAATGDGEDDPVVPAPDGPDPVSRTTRVRVLAMVALGPLVTGYAAVAAVFALVMLLASSVRCTTAAVLAAAMPGWLAAYQVPVHIQGRELGALPLLPTVAVLVLIGRAAAGAAQRLDVRTPRQAGQVVAAIAGAHAIFGLALGLCCAAGPVTVHPLAAAGTPAALAGLASVAGAARHSGVTGLGSGRIGTLVDAYLGPATVCGLRAGLVAVAALLAAGATLLAAGLLTSAATVRDMFAHNASGFGSGLGLLLLSVGYLPNAVVAGAAVAAGPGFSVGTISLTQLNFTGGRVPGLPLLAALPEHPSGVLPMLLAVPVGIGVLTGRSVRDAGGEALTRLRAVAVAAGVVALVFLVLARGAGGALGGGPFDPLDLRAGALAVALFASIGGFGALVACFGTPGPAGEPLDGEELEDEELEDEELEDGDELEDEELEDLEDEELEDEEPDPEQPLDAQDAEAAEETGDVPDQHQDPAGAAKLAPAEEAGAGDEPEQTEERDEPGATGAE